MDYVTWVLLRLDSLMGDLGKNPGVNTTPAQKLDPSPGSELREHHSDKTTNMVSQKSANMVSQKSAA
jgi:hypothetical protein